MRALPARTHLPPQRPLAHRRGSAGDRARTVSVGTAATAAGVKGTSCAWVRAQAPVCRWRLLASWCPRVRRPRQGAPTVTLPCTASAKARFSLGLPCRSSMPAGGKNWHAGGRPGVVPVPPSDFLLSLSTGQRKKMTVPARKRTPAWRVGNVAPSLARWIGLFHRSRRS